MHVSRSSCNLVLAILTTACLAACGGGGDDAPNGVSYRIGGTVSGLGAGKRVVLQNNGGDDLTVTSNGTFNFSTSLTGGAAYAVTVKVQPDGQTCTVTQGTGNTAADVSNVSVACSTGTTPPDTGNGSPIQGVAGVLGVWIQDLCVAANGKGNRQYVSVTKTADNAIMFDQGMMSYAATNCSGTGSPVPGSIFSGGQIVFSRSGSTATLAANWGVWTAVNTHPIIWAVKANSKLCQIGDTTPSSLPTAADVEGYANLMIPNGACYTKQ